MKRILCIALCLALSLSLIACRGKKSKNDGDKTESGTPPTVFAGDESAAASSKLSGATGVTSEKRESTSSDTASDTSSRNLFRDSKTDFTGKLTIVGCWKNTEEISGGETTDVTDDEIVYIFSSDKSVRTTYHGSVLLDYERYEFTETSSGDGYKEGNLTLYYSTYAIKLKCKVEEKKLTLSSNNPSGNNTVNIYERTDYPEEE